jgi:outer membrane protein assembly factor BamB
MKKIKFLLLGLLFAQLNYGQTINWSYAMPAGYGIRPQSPAIAADGTIYIGAANYSSLSNHTFRAINPDGSLKWTYTGMTAYTNSSATIGSDGTILVQSIIVYML